MRRERSTVRGKAIQRRSGSALVMAIVTTMLLFVVGMAFLVSSRTDRQVVSGVEDHGAVNDGIDAVVQQINKVLVEDLFGNDGAMLNNDAGDEYYDYPHTNTVAPPPGADDDRWLASLEPAYNAYTGLYYWRHVTDLYGNNFDIPTTQFWYDPADRGDPSQWASPGASGEYFISVSNAWTCARIITDDEGTEIIVEQGYWNDPVDVNLWGARADADGDGVSDSRWVKVPEITGPAGQNVYTAVRIVDNCGIINVNTAFRNPTLNPPAVTAGGNWDGSRLSHVNLEDIISSTGSGNNLDARDVQRFRYGGVASVPPGADFTNYAFDTQYDDDVAKRILNPAVVNHSGVDYFYAPFEISDELELRNRF